MFNLTKSSLAQGQAGLGAKLWDLMEKSGDVTFLVGPEGEEEEIKSFVCVLCASSTVFQTQFNENWKSQEQIVKLPDIHPKIFRFFLKLLFTDNVNSSHLASPELVIEDILHLLYIANKYDVNSIQIICRLSFKWRLSIKNAVSSYQILQNMNEPELEKKSFNFIIGHFDRLLEEDSFTELSVQSLTTILGSEELSVRELSLFKGICRWAESECLKNDLELTGEHKRNVLGDLLFLIRFPVMSIRDFYKTVQPAKILTREEIIQISSYMLQKGDQSFTHNLQFITSGRPNVSNKALLMATNPVLNNCFVFTSRQETVLNYLQVESTCSDQKDGHRQYNLKLCILSGDYEILPMTTKSISSDKSPLSFRLGKTAAPVIFEGRKSYCIYYDVKRKGVNVPSVVVVKGNSLTFKICCATCKTGDSK